MRDGREAIAVSKIAEEVPGENTHTALILRVPSNIAPIRLKNAVTSVFKKTEWHCSNKLKDESLACFLTVPYDVNESDERLAHVLTRLSSDQSSIKVAGHFARKLGDDDAA